MKKSIEVGVTFKTDDARWDAVRGRDKRADGHFVYAVKTTGVFCRPVCAARLACRENVRFFATAMEAEKAGFRACKRCKPAVSSADEAQAKIVEKVCKLISTSDETPGLQALADAVSTSPSHLHRVFKSLTGVTPKAYAVALRNSRVKAALPTSRTVTAAVYNAGFNSSSGFYESSSKTLGMTPAAFRAGGNGMTIRFAVGQCALGAILVAATARGVCAISLGDDPAKLVEELQSEFPNAEFIGSDPAFENWVAKVVSFVERPAAGLNLPLDIQGTAFQQRVWQKLCEIPCGETRSYREVAREMGAPKSTRAVARACASNRIAVAIPCHRVVRTGGALSGYRWGVERKKALLKRERGARKTE